MQMMGQFLATVDIRIHYPQRYLGLPCDRTNRGCHLKGGHTINTEAAQT